MSLMMGQEALVERVRNMAAINGPPLLEIAIMGCTSIPCAVAIEESQTAGRLNITSRAPLLPLYKKPIFLVLASFNITHMLGWQIVEPEGQGLGRLVLHYEVGQWVCPTPLCVCCG